MDSQILRQFCLVFEITINTNPWDTGLTYELLINLIRVKKQEYQENRIFEILYLTILFEHI